MKIEMLEQCFASYLKNIEGCLLTQTNWTVSNVLFQLYEAVCLKETENIMNEVNTLHLGLDIFKKSTPKQFVNQCEVDVAGIKFEMNKKTVFLYDTAFHENSLHYKDTPATVIKKLIRAFIIADVFFHGFDINIGFISPVCGTKNGKIITDALALIEPILKKHNSHLTIEVYMNSQCDAVVNDLIDQIENITDDNDLFIRSIKLYHISNKGCASVSTASKASTTSSLPAVAKGTNKVIVTGIIDDLMSSGKIVSLMNDLQDKDYSKKSFGLTSFPFLAKSTSISSKDQNRFYPMLYNIGGTMYRVCSQWIPERIKLLESWYDKVK